MSKDSTVTVKIFGNDFRISADEEPSYIQEVARYVDQRMREVSESMVTQSPMKIAILTALNLADELNKLKNRDSFKTDVEEKIDWMLSSLDRVLEKRSPESKTRK
jgi:cell division protein ZapA